MKTLKKSNLLLSGLLLLALSSCGKIPDAYRGTFVEQTSGQSNGMRLKLGKSEGTLTDTSGRSITAKADETQFDSLAQGKAGIYTQSKTNDENAMEIIWLTPDASTRQENSGIVWFTTERLYTVARTHVKNDVQSLQLEYCKDGLLIVDLQTRSWISGCGSNSQPMNFIRVKD